MVFLSSIVMVQIIHCTFKFEWKLSWSAVDWGAVSGWFFRVQGTSLCCGAPLGLSAALAARTSGSVHLCVTRGARSSAARFVFRVMLLFSSKQRKVGGSCVNIQGFPRGGVALTLFQKKALTLLWGPFFIFIPVRLFILGGRGVCDRKHHKTIFGSCCFDDS